MSVVWVPAAIVFFWSLFCVYNNQPQPPLADAVSINVYFCNAAPYKAVECIIGRRFEGCRKYFAVTVWMETGFGRRRLGMCDRADIAQKITETRLKNAVNAT